MNIDTYLTRVGKTIYLEEVNIRELGLALGFRNNGELRRSLWVMRRASNYKLKGSDAKLTGVMKYPYTRANLSMLHRSVNLPFFEWTYSRYYGASTNRLEIIKRFDRMLTELDVFEDKDSDV